MQYTSIHTCFGQAIMQVMHSWMFRIYTYDKQYILWNARWRCKHVNACGAYPVEVCLTFHCHNYIWGCMCSIGPFQFRWLRRNSIAQVIVIIKSEVSTWPIVIIFFRGCVPEMFSTLYSVTHYIYIPGKPRFCFHNYCAVDDKCKYSDTL